MTHEHHGPKAPIANPALGAQAGLRPPRKRLGVVGRPALCARLAQAAATARISIVSAPSGYGKTTLLAETYRYFDHSEVPHIWLSGTHSDSDPAWIDGILARQLSDHLGRPHKADCGFAHLAHEVFKTQPVAVLIDNWDFIETPEMNRYFDRLLQATEGVANFVISSRTTPGFAIEAYRLAGELKEFGLQDLRLDDASCWEILKSSAAAIDPSPHTVKLLGRTEGWPAGVQLLRLALERNSHASELEFSGSREDVSNYLQETLFSGLDAETKAFLCHIAYLDEMSPELIDAILPGQNGAQSFAGIRRENILLNEINEGSSNYRFHTLFRDFLLARAGQYAAHSEAEISARASRFYALRADEVRSIWYAIRAGDVAQSITQIEQYAEARLVAEGRIKMFTEWVKLLLDQQAELPPPVEYWYRWCLVFTGRWEVAAELKHAGSEQRDCIIDAVIGAFSDDQDRLKFAVQRWNANRMDADPFSHAVMFCAAAITEMSAGNYRAAWSEINKASLVVRQTEGGFGRTWVNVLSVLVDIGGGRINDALATANKAIEEAEHSLLPTAPAARMARLASAIVHYHRGDDEGAIEALGYANTESDDHTLPILTVMASAVARELGVFWQKRPFEERPPSAAIDLVSEALSIESMLRTQWDAERFILRMEGFEAKYSAAYHVSPSIEQYGWSLPDLREVLGIRHALATGDLHKANALISPAINRSQRTGRGITEMRLALLRVIVLYRQDKYGAALRSMIQQAERAANDGLYRPFVELRHMLQPLVGDLIEAGRRSPIGRDPAGWARLCDLLGAPAARAQSTEAKVNALSGLERSLQVTTRESEILSFLDLGLSNAEIGQRLGISLPTVKWHLANLYSKLNVKNRASAVRFARDNGLT